MSADEQNPNTPRGSGGARPATPVETHTPSTRGGPTSASETPADTPPYRGPVYGRADGEPHAPTRPLPGRGAAQVKFSIKTAPVSVILLLIMGVIELGLAAADWMAGGFSNVRAIIYNWFGFQPLAFHPVVMAQFGWSGLWGAFGHMMLHGGLLHLTMNGLALAYFAPSVERSAGWLRYLALFVVAGLGGAVGHGLWQFGLFYLFPENGIGALQTSLVGASGAISGILGAFLYQRAQMMRDFPASRQEQTPTEFLIRASAGFLIVNALLSVLNTPISGAAHIGGYLFGVGVAAFIGLGARRPS